MIPKTRSGLEDSSYKFLAANSSKSDVLSEIAGATAGLTKLKPSGSALQSKKK